MSLSSHRARIAGSATTVGLLLAGIAASGLAEKPARADAGVDLSSVCTTAAMSSIVAGAGGITIKQVPNGPQLPGGVRLVPANGKIPAYCQVTGSYVTNPETGRTANFLATFPERWNGKYLQLGCSSTCGFLLMNDPAAPPITITAQGYTGQLIEKGYAIFGNDLGHEAKSPAVQSFDWLKKADGGVDRDALEDYLYRADLVMADMGKDFTRRVYARQGGTSRTIARSYFSGCSQGGREALVAATRFPEKFDGIIAGSPASDQPGMLWSQAARGVFAQQPGLAKLSVGQIQFFQSKIVAACDGLDGVKDGLIQNPAACNITPATAMPICKPGAVEDSCLTQPQADALSLYLNGATTTDGQLIQPGYSITDQSFSSIAPLPAAAPIEQEMRSFLSAKYPATPLVQTRSGGAGGITGPHGVVDARAYQEYLALVRKGTVLPEDFGKLLAQNGKLLWYHNLSDEALTPYMSINRYKRLSQLHGGYDNLQRNIRFFTLPGTGHCGMSGIAPTSFDAIGALEDWVEKGQAPQALLARRLDPAKTSVIGGKVDWSQAPLSTMPLCTFPQMARYKGKGDIKDAASWECKASDRRMLTVGSTGREAGVLK